MLRRGVVLSTDTPRALAILPSFRVRIQPTPATLFRHVTDNLKILMSAVATSLPISHAATDRLGGQRHGLTEQWLHQLVQQLQPDEAVVSAFTMDLDGELHFADGVVVLTDQRLLAHMPHAQGWQAWPLAPGLQHGMAIMRWV